MLYFWENYKLVAKVEFLDKVTVGAMVFIPEHNTLYL